MEKYLVEFTDMPGDEPDLKLFVDTASLTTFLRRNIEEEHYSGDGYILTSIMRYKGEGEVEFLDLECRYTRTGHIDDFVTHGYALVDQEFRKDVAEFTVTIDGRA